MNAIPAFVMDDPAVRLIHPAEMTADHWEDAAIHLDNGLTEKADMTVESVLQDILLARVQLWLLKENEGICTTRINHRPLISVLEIEWIIGVGWDEWIGELEEKLTEFARDNGCVRIEAMSPRKGMRRWCKKYDNWNESEYRIFYKRISDG